jgi:glycerol kinase
MIAGLAVGYWKNLNELRANWKTDKEWQPVMDAARRDDMIKHWHMAIEKTLNWA